jgi:hypothetical protein
VSGGLPAQRPRQRPLLGVTLIALAAAEPADPVVVDTMAD